MAAALRCVAMLCLLGGCTLVRVTDGDVSRTRLFPGILQIHAQPSQSVTTVRTEGVGIVPTSRGLTVGWAREQLALVTDPDACRIIIFDIPDNDEAARQWRELLAGRSDICVIPKEAE